MDSSSEEPDFEDTELESEIDDESHNQLLNAICSLDNRKKKPIKQRTEAASKVGEFNLNEAEDSKLKLGDLVGGLKKTDKNVKLKQQIRAASKQKVLSAPLNKPQTERLSRTVAYNKVSTEVDKWNNIVQRNRFAEQITYPLKQPDLHLQPLETVIQRYQNKTPMEQEISDLLKESKNVPIPDKELTPAEEEALKAMSVEEALERRNELRKMRALQTYQEAKARRQNKIKSKKYHRLLKKDRLKKQLKAFEALQKLNPELALQKLEDMEESRIKERMSLKHRNTGKWAKHHMIRAKYDNESREALREQIQINKNLTAKKKPVSDSEEESEELVINIDNTHVENESGNEGKRLTKRQSSINHQSIFNEQASNEKLPHILETLNRKKSLEDFEFSQTEVKRQSIDELKEYSASDQIEKTNQQDDNLNSKKVEIDPTKFISLESKPLKSSGADFTGIEEEVLESEGEDDSKNYMTISEAFADDDVIEEFKSEKAEIVDKHRPRDIDLTLPGWGSWGGPGVKVSKRKRRRFTIKSKPTPPRKDRNLGNVIINENCDRSISTHQVNEPPHHCKSVAHFEKGIDMPIGRTWNTENSFNLLTKPRVVTKLGAIIEPMDADELAKSTFTKKNAAVKRNKRKSSAKI